MTDINSLLLHHLAFDDPILGRNWTTETRMLDIRRLELEIETMRRVTPEEQIINLVEQKDAKENAVKVNEYLVDLKLNDRPLFEKNRKLTFEALLNIINTV